MNIVDIFLIILLAGAAISGFIKGFFVELASIASLVIGIWAGVQFSSLIEQWLSRYVAWDHEIMLIFSFVLIFVFVVMIVHLIATLTEKFVKAIALSFLSRLAGAVFGTLKAAFILSFLMILISKIEASTITLIPERQKAESKLYGPIEKMAPNVFPILKAIKEQKSEHPAKGATT